MSGKRLTTLATSVAVFSLFAVAFSQVASNAAKAAAPSKAPIDVLASAGPNAVVAIINGETVTKKELSDLLWGNQANYILDRALINNILIAQKAKKLGVTVTEKDIQAKINDIQKTSLAGKSVETALGEMGISRAAWVKTSIEPQIMVDKILDKEIKVTDADTSQFILARHILIRTQSGQGEAAQAGDAQAKADAEAKAKIDSIALEIKNGKDFSAAADQYTQDPSNTDPKSNKGKGGSLGWFKKGRMMKEFEDAAFALKPGEISAPVKTSYGWHIIKLDKLGKDATGAEKLEIRKQLVDEKKATLQRDFWTNIRTGQNIVNKLVTKQKATTMAPPAGARPVGRAPMPPAPPKPAPAVNAQPK
jgi:foldase protein PrsA